MTLERSGEGQNFPKRAKLRPLHTRTIGFFGVPIIENHKNEILTLAFVLEMKWEKHIPEGAAYGSSHG